MIPEKSELKKPGKRVFLAFSAIMIILFAACFELILRIQQSFGQIYDLEFNDLARLAPSDTLNHMPKSGQAFDGRKYDQFGVRQYAALEKPEICPHPIKILFLGDSFMDGYDDDHTIPSFLFKLFAKQNICINPVNVGLSSYSPAIFVPQLRTLYPIIKPDYVVIDIDETDFFDDNFRYKQFITRDESGRNIGVKAASAYRGLMSEIDDMRSQRLYIVRLLKVFVGKYAKLLSYRRNAGEKAKEISPIFELSSLDPAAAREKFKAELAFFKGNVEELVSVLEENQFPLSHLIFIRHPHLNHLLNGKNGSIFNSVIFETVKDVAENKNVLVYDATPDLRRLFKDKAESYYFPNDMHFNFDGMEAYSKVLAERIRPVLAQEPDFSR
ncbi:SGNH/GDSL hydrolase family protein [Methylocystis sp.]|uniref:SGNH/GDSL hydrolase family protein n=1 Tax=Methylocystis sp. TaxID=1911079 RepID=UPI0025ECC309|nr:SGNH/GDSL hydrolase family protein [Methylocystis sp.]